MLTSLYTRGCCSLYSQLVDQYCYIFKVCQNKQGLKRNTMFEYTGFPMKLYMLHLDSIPRSFYYI